MFNSKKIMEDAEKQPDNLAVQDTVGVNSEGTNKSIEFTKEQPDNLASEVSINKKFANELSSYSNPDENHKIMG